MLPKLSKESRIEGKICLSKILGNKKPPQVIYLAVWLAMYILIESSGYHNKKFLARKYTNMYRK